MTFNLAQGAAVLINLSQFFKCLSDETRLNITLLIHKDGELCVCEIKEALEENQPKISRHLAQLRNCGILTDDRRAQWVFYNIHPELPQWGVKILDNACAAHSEKLACCRLKLEQMCERPVCH